MISVHHLDCCTMCVIGGRRLVHERGYLVAHCLLLETERSGLVLVDTGIGTDDVAAPRRRLGTGFVTFFRPLVDAARTAVRQVEALGFDPADVRHVVVTHLDVDHAGGLPDFPHARVHVHIDEHAAAMARATLNERMRYRTGHWAHGPDWALYPSGEGEAWFGFAVAHALAGLPEEILAVPLPGHTRGHSAVAVHAGGRWLLHAGDAYFHRSTVAGPSRRTPPGIRLFERSVAMDRRQVEANHGRLRELIVATSGQVDVFCAHDTTEFDELASPVQPN